MNRYFEKIKKNNNHENEIFFLNVMPFNFCFFNVCFVSCFLFSYVFVLFVFVCFSSLTVASLTREKKIDTTKAKNIELRVKENGKKNWNCFSSLYMSHNFYWLFFLHFLRRGNVISFFFCVKRLLRNRYPFEWNQLLNEKKKEKKFMRKTIK